VTVEYAEPQPAPPPQDWADHGLCQARSDHGICFRDAAVAIDGHPVCWGHLGLFWERWQAWGISPEMAERLPPLGFQ